MNDTNITGLDDSKAMRAMGAPLNTPVKERQLSQQSKKKIAAVYKTTGRFGKALLEWAADQSGPRFAAVCRAWNKLNDALAETSAEPQWVEQSDGTSLMVNVEAVMVSAITQPSAVVCSQWDEILTALENGEPYQLNGEQAPWPFGPFPQN